MPGAGNAVQYQINVLLEKLKTEKDPIEIAKIQERIKNLQDQLAGR